ncbi:hypothetical protein [Streptomyces platensis]|uniref:hypothetical protein n=1 Tax=Streptomyces platensis TaxID=58346 RepID=UPI003321A481
MRPSPAEMQTFTFYQIEVGEPDPRWVRCELRYRHKDHHHYASAEGVLVWWKRKHKRKRSRR